MAEITRRPFRGSPNRNDRRGQSGRPQGQRSGASGGGIGSPSDGSNRVAVPWYVGQNFSEASPGHRYLSYLPFWKNDWSAIKDGKQKVLKDLGPLPDHVGRLMQALAARQHALGEAIGAEILAAVSTSPFATGLGWEHPNENGFAFLQPYGLPYLAGSGVKGVLRHAARELAQEEEARNHGWNYTAIKALFGLEPAPGSDNSIRGALRFFDVIPELAGNRMDVDIMNPHYGEYYQGKSTPHDAGSPFPIFFLIIPPGSKFTFVVDCPRERCLAPEVSGRWRNFVRAAFQHAFNWLGFGAKTAVGYGAMAFLEANEAKSALSAPVSAAQQIAGGPVATRPPSAASNTAEVVWENAKITWQPGPRIAVAIVTGEKPAQAQGNADDEFLNSLSVAQRKQLQTKKELSNIPVVVEITGNRRILKRIAN